MVTDDVLKALLARPELMPPPEACAAEQELHRALLRDPWRNSDATRIGDAIWDDDGLDDATRAQLIGLFRLTFRDPTYMIEKVRGEPVYLLLAMTGDAVLRLKPQNLITGLPIANAEAVN
ncbi:hypothetical protein OZ411_42785 [Bradyrhizobium sp. Arg237L]|uniref:hypothetical protein n=1 Tax=Bradyrhizobium sp. Arg237L TaxID=3003352 RepID=UPI00249E94C2|nr:hypothetical protein [Bradyrhizobium sp. Arg237L]MDI4239512.1 hypothetical protein [Bradyrhizobium sp. Arg237L]